ncbi:hypothetical protein [sulfur-oxidizing endosymbiont of Gigantopelta aegis]|uniref:hypothetical protein n=1 Tax=sulfur-oxidizing endosymbiont of Gigantopelta aegis TaxID=2794934 RepID=UPI0018DC3534|nr:hypothetical protein [sulfur-oxidizing endosymbiont of Gigantopelta aegis]
MKKLIMGLVAVAVLGVSQVAVSARSIIDNVTIKRILIDNVSFLVVVWCCWTKHLQFRD